MLTRIIFCNPRITKYLVMTGLDPVIFFAAKKEDARVKRGQDDNKECGSRKPPLNPVAINLSRAQNR